MRLWTMLGIAGLVIAVALATTLLIANGSASRSAG